MAAATSQLIDKMRAILCVMCLSLFGCVSTAGTATTDRHYQAVLDAALVAQRGGEYRAMDRLFDLRRESKDANRQLVDLLDYYLGEAAGEVMQEFITHEGTKIEPLLQEKRKMPLNCLPKYQAICRKDIASRNRQIDYMLDAIRKGIVLKSAD
jgi:hypothetical protein